MTEVTQAEKQQWLNIAVIKQGCMLFTVYKPQKIITGEVM